MANFDYRILNETRGLRFQNYVASNLCAQLITETTDANMNYLVRRGTN